MKGVGAILILAVAGACRGVPLEDPSGPATPEPDVIVAAWAEPATLPAGGGHARIIVKVQRKGGSPLANTRVRLRSRPGTLESRGRTLLTDGHGVVQDRLKTARSASVDVYARGIRYRFRVLVSETAAP